MKEGLADIWIDLTEFPYYKNYVRNYKEDTDEIIINLSRFDDEEAKLSKTILEKVKNLLDKRFGNLVRAFIEDGILYVHYHSFSEIFKQPIPNDRIETKEINGKEYKYIPIELTDEELNFLLSQDGQKDNEPQKE
jgi:hypothetical protein